MWIVLFHEIITKILYINNKKCDQQVYLSNEIYCVSKYKNQESFVWINLYWFYSPLNLSMKFISKNNLIIISKRKTNYNLENCEI